MASSVVAEWVERYVVESTGKTRRIKGYFIDDRFFEKPIVRYGQRTDTARVVKAYPSALVFATQEAAAKSFGARKCWYVQGYKHEVCKGMGKETGDGPRVFFGGSASSRIAHWTRASALKEAIAESRASEVERRVKLEEQRLQTKKLRGYLKAEKAAKKL